MTKPENSRTRRSKPGEQSRQQSSPDHIDKADDYFLADRHREVYRRPWGPANRRLREPCIPDNWSGLEFDGLASS